MRWSLLRLQQHVVEFACLQQGAHFGGSVVGFQPAHYNTCTHSNLPVFLKQQIGMQRFWPCRSGRVLETSWLCMRAGRTSPSELFLGEKKRLRGCGCVGRSGCRVAYLRYCGSRILQAIRDYLGRFRRCRCGRWLRILGGLAWASFADRFLGLQVVAHPAIIGYVGSGYEVIKRV